jgi:uncharacterized repeat protein (TIGR04076 family)
LSTCKKVSVYVDKVYGCCPIVVEGDKLVFDGALRLDECEISSDAPNYFEGRPQLCSWALHSLFHYVVAMCYGVSAVELGISKGGEDGYVMCPAWGPPTCEAAVIWRLHPEPIPVGFVDRFYTHLAKLGHYAVPDYYMQRFASEEAKQLRRDKLAEYERAGEPKFWDGWENAPYQPRRQRNE